jgi:acyl-coenzyme A synthetase/AMP-(fatty) acid ligase
MPDQPIADQSEGAAMLYSSGTTGYPKGVKRPLRNRITVLKKALIC